LGTVIIVALAVLTAANVFFYIRLRLIHRSRCANPVAAIFLPFLAYMICVLVFDLSVPWHVLLWGVIAQFVQSFFGYYLDRFERSMRFDRYMHGLACFSYGLLIYFTLSALIGGSIPAVWAAILTGALGETFGVLIEHFEFLEDMHGKSPMRHQKSLRDTNFDLIANTIGSVLAGVYAYLALAAS